VAVMVEARGEHAGFIAIKTLSAVSKHRLGAAARAKIAPGQNVHTDGWRPDSVLQDLGHDHRAEAVQPRPLGNARRTPLTRLFFVWLVANGLPLVLLLRSGQVA
jgi:hypothetical protein